MIIDLDNLMACKKCSIVFDYVERKKCSVEKYTVTCPHCGEENTVWDD